MIVSLNLEKVLDKCNSCSLKAKNKTKATVGTLGKEGDIPNLIKVLYENPIIILNDEKDNFFTLPKC